MGLIPEEVIEKIRLSADIVDVIREVLPLKKAGRLWRAPCPFHSEKDPSFTVYQDKQIYKCFGCNAGGNIFGFVMQYYTMDFPEAVRYLGGKFGIEVPESGGSRPKGSSRERLFEINEMATAWFKEQYKKLPDNALPKKYLLKNRGLDKKTIEEFDLGFAPDSWDGLLNALTKKKVPQKQLLELGLVNSKDSNRVYDRFRNRVMFTFRASAGRVIGFSGRLMQDGEPKYMNSPESRIFKKGSNFFGLNFAGRQIPKKKRAIVCEGNFDLVAMHQYGFRETVAVLGSALTEKHVTILERYTPNIYLLFDGDSAGRKAMWRSLELFLPSKVQPKVVLLPEGDDPDSYLVDNGRDAMEKLIDSAPFAMDHAIESRIRAAGDNIERKVSAVDELSRMVSKVSDPVRQEHYIRELVAGAGENESTIRRKLKSLSPGRARPISADKPKKTDPKKSVLTQAALILAAISVLRPEIALLSRLDEVHKLIPDHPLKEDIIEILTLTSLHPEDEPADPGKYLARINNPELSGTITSLVVEWDGVDLERHREVYKDLLKKLQMAGFDKMIKKIKDRIDVAKKNNDNKLLSELIVKKQELIRKKEEAAGDFYRNE